MIAAFSEPLSRTLHVLPGLRWFFDLNPAVAVLVLWCFSPGVMWFNDIFVVRGYLVPLSYQWFSALADTVLAVGAGVMLYALHGVARVPHWLQHWPAHVGILLVGLAASAWHTLAENSDIPTLERRLGLNSIYHNLLLFPVLWYVMWLLVIVTCVTVFGPGLVMWKPVFALVVAVICGLTWYGAGVYDGAHQKAPNGVSKHVYANPGRAENNGHSPWCGGLITRYICGGHG